MGDVVDFNGLTSLDICPDRVIEKASGELSSVVIIGYHKDGSEYFASSIADGADINWMIDRAKLRLLQIVDGN